MCDAKGTDVHVVEQSHNESQNYVLNVKEDNTKAQPNIKCRQCMVQIQGTAVNILVDSGSPYTIIPNELYENLFADIELCDSDISPGVMVYAYRDARVFPGNGTIQSEEKRRKSLRVDAWCNHYGLGHASET